MHTCRACLDGVKVNNEQEPQGRENATHAHSIKYEHVSTSTTEKTFDRHHQDKYRKYDELAREVGGGV